MAQTPKSVSAYIGSTVPTTLYTVPTGATAVVNSALTSSLIGGYASMTINKVSNGVTYPLVVNAISGYDPSTNYPQNSTLNLLNGPVTLTAGDVISASTSTTGQYKFPATLTPTTNVGQRINNMNYLNGRYIAVGYDNTAGLGLILTSTDGITWTKQTFPYYMVITDIGFDGTNYVVCGSGNLGYIYYSTNLSSWTQVSMGTTQNMYCITYGNSKWVAAGASGAVVYATTPSSWTYTSIPTSANISAVLVIGTNFCFGSDNAYLYTSDFSTYVKPYVPPNTPNTSNQFSMDATGRLYSTTSFNPQNDPTRSLYTSTNNAKTFTAVDLSALSNRPVNYGFPYSFSNGVTMYWQWDHSGSSYYLYTTNGTTWATGNYSGTYGAATETFYSTNLFGLYGGTSYNSIVNWLGSSFVLLFVNVASNGTTTGFAFASGNQYVDPNGYGALVCAGNPTQGTWMALGYNPSNSAFFNYWYGGNTTTGSNSTYTNNAYYINSYGTPICAIGRPGGNGYIVGSSNGYVGWTTASTGGFGNFRRPLGTTSIVGMIASGNTTASKIVVLYSNGQNAYSTDQGVTWTAGNSINQAFYQGAFQSGGVLQYANGVFIAYSYATGSFYYSTDGANWIGNPFNITNMYTLNSNNVFLQSTSLTYTTGTNPDTFIQGGTYPSGGSPSVRRMTYVNGTYFIGGQNVLSQSTDLQTWTTNSFSGQQINNQLYYSNYANSNVSIAYSGSGTSFVIGNSLRNVSSDNVSFGQPTAVANALVVGSTTLGIVEIT